jgi:mono/diheme cytochrome c family protein
LQKSCRFGASNKKNMKKIIFSVVVLAIAASACSKKTTPTATEKKEPPVNAASVFTNNCSRCHGATGIEGRAPNLSKIDNSHASIEQIINNGKGKMPSFSEKLSKNDISALADWVLALRK